MKKVIAILLVLLITVVTAYAFATGAGVNYVRQMHPQVNTVGLIGHWKLWDGLMTTGLVFDYSLQGNTGTVVDTDAPVAPTLIPTYPGFYFDGANDYINTNDTFQSTFQGSFSISIWVKPTDGQPDAAGYFFGIATGTDEDCVWMLLNTIGSLTFQYSSNGNRGRLYVNGGVPLFSDGQQGWHHLVMVVDSTIRDVGGVKGYFDGVLQPLGALSKGDTTNVVSADFVSILNPFIGGENTVAGVLNLYNGLIDDVMLFGKAFSAIEAKNIYEITRWRYDGQ